jgi:DNA-binding transcriptional ArsR family regulator
MRTEAPALLPIFRSQQQGELLARLLLDPERESTVTELAAAVGAPKQTVQGEVERLVVAGILRDRRQGRNRLVRANVEHSAFGPLSQLVMQTFGPQGVVAEEFGAVRGVERVVIFGSWAARFLGEPGPPARDIDVLVVGKTSRMAVFEAADRAQRRIGIEVNPESASVSQWENPRDWALLVEIQNRPFVEVFTRRAASAATA